MGQAVRVCRRLDLPRGDLQVLAKLLPRLHVWKLLQSKDRFEDLDDGPGGDEDLIDT